MQHTELCGWSIVFGHQFAMRDITTWMIKMRLCFSKKALIYTEIVTLERFTINKQSIRNYLIN